jgi:hypothetical protein
MKTKQQKTLRLISALWCVTFLLSCDKSSNPLPVVTPTARCVLQHESTGLAGNSASWNYEYDSDGMPLKISMIAPTGLTVSVLEVYYNSTFSSVPNSVSNRSVKYDADLFEKKLPTMAKVSITTTDGLTLVDYLQYFFFYDEKSRLIKVGQQTNFVGDWEWDMTIYYNDKNNVTALQYEWTTGPSQPPTTIVASGYDNNPTPYACMSMWKFLSNNFAWDNYDPEPVLTALSANNPGYYSFGTGDNQWERFMSYTYNDHGFPLERINTNKNKNGEYTFVQTFSYVCP